jgi:Holliday junction resolvasome RuvABC DNA-binding subunit
MAETHARVFAALRGLGFREREVRHVLAELSPSLSGREADLESVLRCALSRLTSHGAGP